jgi:hypothetical protein
MPTLHELTSGTSTTTFNFGSIPVSLTYFPGKVTEEFMGQVLAFEHMDEHTFAKTFDSFNITLCDLIESWDITEDDGVTMFPLDPARFVKLPLQLRFRLAQEIMASMRPNTDAPKTLNS